MIDELGYAPARRLLVIAQDMASPFAVQRNCNEYVAVYSKQGITNDEQGMCHELAHTFRIYGKPLIDEGLAGLIECLAIRDSEKTAQLRIARDIVLAGFNPGSSHSLGLYVFACAFRKSGWAGVRKLVDASDKINKDKLRDYFLAKTKNEFEYIRNV
jgi:hypothetical protein